MQTAVSEASKTAVCIQTAGSVRGRREPESGFEAVAHAGFGDQVTGMRGVGFQLAAELGQVYPQVMGLGLVTRAPHLGEQLPLADQSALVADQKFKDAPLGGG